MLQPGTNVFLVTAFDQAGNSGNDTLTVIYQTPKQDQIITFPALANRTFGDAPIPLAAAASSGLLVQLSVISGPASCSNNVLSLPTEVALRPVLRGRIPAKQSVEARLLKVGIVSQGAGNAAFPHQVERNAVGERPFLVRAVAMEPEASGKKFGGGVNQRVVRIARYQLYDPVGARSVGALGKIVDRLAKDVFSDEHWF